MATPSEFSLPVFNLCVLPFQKFTITFPTKHSLVAHVQKQILEHSQTATTHYQLVNNVEREWQTPQTIPLLTDSSEQIFTVDKERGFTMLPKPPLKTERDSFFQRTWQRMKISFERPDLQPLPTFPYTFEFKVGNQRKTTEIIYITKETMFAHLVFEFIQRFSNISFNPLDFVFKKQQDNGKPIQFEWKPTDYFMTLFPNNSVKIHCISGSL